MILCKTDAVVQLSVQSLFNMFTQNKHQISDMIKVLYR